MQLTNNRIYSPKLNATNLFQYSPTTDVPGAGNTYDSHMADAPALNNTPPIAWAPPTTPQTLTVTANGVEDDTATYTNDPHSTDLSTFPHLVLWWNGLPLTPAPVVVTANALAQQKQTITYNVSVITGVPNYMAGYFANPGCCYIAPGGSHPGRQLYWQTALLGDGAPMDISSDWVAPGTNITFMPSNSPFR